jgi:hypothetical protein
MELDGRYVDIGVRRWQAFMGMQATLFGDGRPFDVVAAERLSSNGAVSSNSISDSTSPSANHPSHSRSTEI